MSFMEYPQPDACRALMPTPEPAPPGPPSRPMVCHMPKGHDGPHAITRRPRSLDRRWEGDARPAPAPARYAQCDETCTVDCGHCKGAGRPAPLAADAEQEWLVDHCVCGHHITAHAKGKDACRYHPGNCTAYRWDEVGIRRVPARPAEGTDELREAIAAEQARHQGLRGPMDDERPDVWQNRCVCGWDDGDEHPGWLERYRLHIADALLAGPLASLLATVTAEGGAALIAAERRRQVEQEGWTAEHDAHHSGEPLALAACCYAVPPQMRKYRPVSVAIEGGVAVQTVPTLWPWAPGYWKPNAEDRIRELVKAGALIAAEIDRLRALGGESRG